MAEAARIEVLIALGSNQGDRRAVSSQVSVHGRLPSIRCPFRFAGGVGSPGIKG